MFNSPLTTASGFAFAPMEIWMQIRWLNNREVNDMSWVHSKNDNKKLTFMEDEIFPVECFFLEIFKNFLFSAKFFIYDLPLLLLR